MNVSDFSAEFDLLYNNALSNSAAEINLYEKSLFLTQAQEEIIREAYDSKRTQTSFESSEAIRRRLNELTITKVSMYNEQLDTALAGLKLSDNSRFFKIESDVWYISYERVNTETSQLYIVPTALDAFNNFSDNPFKMPNRHKAWRLDSKNTGTQYDKVVEIISTVTPVSYVYRYLKAPEPIVLADLEDLFPGAGLSINGVDSVNECKLNSEIHRTILKRAVEIATMAYKENLLSNNLQLNNRNN
jgi:hypothetical protein